MIKIGITGSIASGKSSVAKLISKRRYLIFNADKAVATLYKKKYFIKKVKNKFNIKETKNIKKKIKNILNKNRKKLKELEHIIHPLVRKEMKRFIRRNKNKKFIFLEIPLLIESKLNNYFDKIIFIRSKYDLRLKRFMSKGGNKKLFSLLDGHQIKDTEKMKLCDHIVVNNESLSVLKNKLSNIIKLYE